MLKGLRHIKGLQIGAYKIRMCKGRQMRGLFIIRDLYSSKKIILTAKYGNKEAMKTKLNTKDTHIVQIL
jgi:hypothetical protein